MAQTIDGRSPLDVAIREHEHTCPYKDKVEDQEKRLRAVERILWIEIGAWLVLNSVFIWKLADLAKAVKP
jgi:hypothetical protein